MNNENQNFNNGNGFFVPGQQNPNNQPQGMQTTPMPSQPIQNNTDTQLNNFNMAQSATQSSEQISNYQSQANVQNTNTNNTMGINNNTQSFQSNFVPNQPAQNNLNTQIPNSNMNINGLPNENNSKPKNKSMLLIGGIAVVVIVIVIILFSGKTTKLTCTSSISENGIKMNLDTTIKFKKNDVSSVDAKITIELGEYASYKNELIESLEDEYDSDYFKITSDDKNVYVTASANKNNYSDLNIFNGVSYEEIKQELEEDGFTCK